jgi:3-oxoadipate enol-lactonase
MDGFVDTPGARIRYRVDGPEHGPPVLLSNALGTTADMWSPQVEQLQATLRLIRYDTRGHGESSAPAGEYTLEELGEDAMHVLDAVGVDEAHICGLSLGGLTAMWIGIFQPSRVRGLIVADTAARIGTTERWNERVAKARAEGMIAIADLNMGNWFTAAYREQAPETVARIHRMVAACNPDGYIGCCAALRDADLRAVIDRVRARTLVIAGSHDPSTTLADAEFISQHIPDATLLTLDAAHLSNIECASSFTRHIEAFVSVAEQRYGATS